MSNEEMVEKLGVVRAKIIAEMEVVNTSRRALAGLLQEVDLLENRLTKELARLRAENALLRAKNEALETENELLRKEVS